jgi:PAS domain S-box-containing protein
VSSRHRDHLSRLDWDRAHPAAQSSCWDLLACTRVLCPAHGNRAEDCWMIPKTQCEDNAEKDIFRKLPSCLTCLYFKQRADWAPLGQHHFITEQVLRFSKKALEGVYQREESFVEILNRIPDGLFTTDEIFRITFFNPAAERITGFSAHDAVGMYCKDVFKNPKCETDCALKRAVAAGTDLHNREYLIKNIEGEKVPIICSTSAFRDGSGRVIGGLEIFKDITGVKKLQEEIVKSEKKYRRIFEGSHDMIYTTTPQGKILDVNQAGVGLLGYRNKEELLAINSARDLYVNPKDRDRFLKEIESKGYVKDFEVDFNRADGTPIHVLISSRRYGDPESGDVEIEGIIKDITRRKQAEEACRQRNLELSMRNEIAVTLNLTMDLKGILVVTLKNVLNALRLKRGAIFLIEEEKAARVKARYGLPAENEEEEIFFFDTLLQKHIFKEKAKLKPQPAYPCFRVVYGAKKRRKTFALSCFLITFKGKPVGFFGLDIPSSRELNPYETHLLGSLANSVGGAIENARLVEMIRLHRQELRKLTEKLFRIQEQERRRIARELHDEAGQALAAINLGLERLAERGVPGNDGLRADIDEIRKVLSRTSSEIRRLSHRLHPALLTDLGLGPALEFVFRELKKNSNLNIQFRMVGFDHRLPGNLETIIYRFSQEALTNTLKHAEAQTFQLSIIKSFPKIIFLAQDDGKGFDGHIVGSDKLSLGLLGMRERASMLGGTFNLRTKPGEGTRIRIEIPLQDKQAHEKTDSHTPC